VVLESLACRYAGRGHQRRRGARNSSPTELGIVVAANPQSIHAGLRQPLTGDGILTCWSPMPEPKPGTMSRRAWTTFCNARSSESQPFASGNSFLSGGTTLTWLTKTGIIGW